MTVAPTLGKFILLERNCLSSNDTLLPAQEEAVINVYNP